MKSLDALTEELRAALNEQELRTLTAEAHDVLEKQYNVGTVHKWGGIEFKKKGPGDWVKVPVQKHLATIKRDGKRASPAHLPDHPERYFKSHSQSVKIPVAALQTTRARAKGLKNAVGRMARAYNGEGPRRKPISVKDNNDGTYTVLDGNSTTAIARQHGWKHVHAVVAPHGTHEPAHHEPAPPSASSVAPHVSSTGKPRDIPGLREVVKAGKLAPGKNLSDHVRIAHHFLEKHQENLKGSLDKLKSVMPEGVHIQGRVKDVRSALGKLVRKPKYGTVEKLQDGTGMRVIAPDTKTLDDSIKALKSSYKIVAEDDYEHQPLGGDEGLGYRSFHAVIEDGDGLQKEVQLRTPNQNAHADWCHDVYKPVTPEQDSAMKENAATIAQYARSMGDYFYSVDSGKKGSGKPDCPPAVQQYFSCL